MHHESSQGSYVTRESYHLAPEALDQLEFELVSELRGQIGEDNEQIVVAVVSPQDPYADFVRTQETLGFQHEGYDFYEGMKPYEDQSLFLLTVNLGQGVVAHVKRITIPLAEEQRTETTTGIEIIDDRLDAKSSDEQVALATIMQAHGIANLDQCANIATNIRTRRGPADAQGDLHTLSSYKAVFLLTRQNEWDYLFAYLNKGAILSLSGKLGVEYQMLAGGHYHLPDDTKAGGYDIRYEGVCIAATEHNVEAFTKSNPDYPLTEFVATYEVPMFGRVSKNSDWTSL